jgi:hypothetical protein
MRLLERISLRLRGVDPDELEEELRRMDEAKEKRQEERRHIEEEMEAYEEFYRRHRA